MAQVYILGLTQPPQNQTLLLHLLAFGADGFSLTGSGNAADQVNDDSDTYVAWNWLAGTAFSNDASATSVGTIDSVGQVNTEAGFSIISWTGTGSHAGTIAHGISKPELIIVKNRDQADKWVVYHEASKRKSCNRIICLLTESSAFGASYKCMERHCTHFNSIYV